MPLQVQSSDEVFAAFKASKSNVAMLLPNMYFQSKSFGGLEVAMITMDEEAEVLGFDMTVQTTLPFGLVAAELASQQDLKKEVYRATIIKTRYGVKAV